MFSHNNTKTNKLPEKDVFILFFFFFFFEILSDLNQAVPNHLADKSQTR